MVAAPEKRTLQERNAVIPQELKNLHQWARWIKGTRDKMPANLDGSAMEWSNRDKWLIFDQVARYPQIGYFHTLESGIIGIDFDGCRNKETGEIHPVVLRWIKDTYAEVSPNQEGIKAYFKGTIPNGKKIQNKNVPWGDPEGHTGIEIYAQKRFFTVTGNIVPGCPSKIIEAPEILNDIIVHFAEAPKVREKVLLGPMIGNWDVDRWICQHLDVVEKLADGYIVVCPWCTEHTTPGDTARIWTSPKYTFNCFHAHCAGREWHDVRLKHEPDAYNKREPWASTVPYSPGQDHSTNGNSNEHQTQKQITQPDLETIIQRLGENEYGDGLLFAEVFNGQVCHDHSEKAWYLWNKHHWKKDTTGKIKQMVSGHLGSIYLKARGDVHKQMVDIQAEVEQRQKENKEDEKLPKLNARLAYLGGLMEALEKRARALRGANRMKNALTFAMSEHNIGITADIWDSDPWLIAVNNGVVDLRTGQLRDGYPIDYIRSVSPTEWTGLNTPCPRFESFLQEIFEVLPEAQLQKLTDGKFHELPKEEQERITAEHRKKLTDFLQRLLGYSLAGLSTEAIFPLLYGEEGRNGKDTLFKVLKFVLGLAIADAISNDVFLSADRGRAAGAATPHLADLQGKRMVWGSETKQGDRINVSQIKQLTGGGDISARKNYGDQYTFAPTHTLFLMTNYKPHADAKDKAFWSRACLIEFALRFVDKPQGPNERKADTNLAEDLKAEASGILAWLVRGCLDYQKQGLNRPEIVLLSTESYRASEDNIQQFIDDCCVLHEKVSVGAQKLYDTYKAWCGSNNLNHINGKLFGEDMSKRFKKERKTAGMEYQKIGIRTDETPPEGPSNVGSKSKNVGSNPHSTSPAETASEAASEHSEESNDVEYVGFVQKVPYSTPREDKKSTLYGSTLHTLHTTEEKKATKQPLERDKTSVKGQEAPYINPTHSLETFWLVGKKHRYPEIPDLDLKGGITGWNSFTIAHKLLMPDVIARLGGL